MYEQTYIDAAGRGIKLAPLDGNRVHLRRRKGKVSQGWEGSAACMLHLEGVRQAARQRTAREIARMKVPDCRGAREGTVLPPRLILLVPVAA
jgi:hypothetical protein